MSQQPLPDSLGPDWNALARSAARFLVQSTAHACGFEGCKKRSLGVTCHECARYCCLDHLVLTTDVPPRGWCVRCVADYVAEQTPPQKSTRARKKRQK